jgi:glucose-1-phosphate adenylyltransferase
MRSPAGETLAIVLAGGRGTRLGPLTDHECKPALPFAACARTIDFTLSNCLNSGIRDIAVATQYRPETLSRHLTEIWQPIAREHDARITEWSAGRCGSIEGFLGTADAIYKNWTHVQSRRPSRVLILAGDHVYRMDYRPMLEFHAAKRADVTVGCLEVEVAEANQFGVLAVDDAARIVRFDEKPRRPKSLPGDPHHALASMGIYVFATDVLQQALVADRTDTKSGHDFGHNVIPALIGHAQLYAFAFAPTPLAGAPYWRDIGTPAAYWQAHMDLLDGCALTQIQTSWPLLTLPRWPRCEARGDATIACRDALIAPTAAVDKATILHSVIGERAQVGADSFIRDSLVLPDARIGRNCFLDGVIVTAGCRIADNAIIGRPAMLRRRGPEPDAPIIVTSATCEALDRRRATRPRPVRSDRPRRREYA